MFTALSALVERAKQGNVRKLAVAAAADKPVLEAVGKAVQEGIVEAVLVGEKSALEAQLEELGFGNLKREIIDEPDAVATAAEAVKIVRSGGADILMKGLVATGPLLKAVLDKDGGLRSGSLLSHAGLFQSPYYHKLLAVTDAAMNVAPTLDEKAIILNNAVDLYHRLGLALPKAAALAAVETVNPKMEATVHAALLAQMNKRGQIQGCLVDGPLALDNAVSKEAAEHKGITGEVAGDADILLVPDIESGNFLYKALNFLGGAAAAGIVLGAKVPIVLTSRADSEETKFYSIALAAALR